MKRHRSSKEMPGVKFVDFLFLSSAKVLKFTCVVSAAIMCWFIIMSFFVEGKRLGVFCRRRFLI